jgi:hypothetical protein
VLVKGLLAEHRSGQYENIELDFRHTVFEAVDKFD